MIAFAALQACSPAKLLYNTSGFKPGYSVSYKFLTNTETTTAIMKQTQNQVTNQETDYNYQVQSMNPDGSVNWLVTIYRYRYESEDPQGNPVVYDSSDPNRDTSEVRSQLFEQIVGMNMKMTTATDGEITALSGAADLLERIGNRFPESPMKQGFIAMMKSSFSDSSLIATMGGLFGFLPKNAVKTGSKWSVSRKVRTLFGINFTDNFTLKSRNDTQAVIAIKTKAKTPDSDEAVMDLGNIKIRYDLTGEGSGKKTISQPDGMLIGGVNNLTLTGMMTINGGIKAPITTKTTVTIEKL